MVNNLASRVLLKTSSLVVLLVLDQSCLPMYQALETFSFYILSEHQSQIPLSPKNAAKIIFNTREVLRSSDSAQPDICSSK